jgi:hypothetical protein
MVSRSRFDRTYQHSPAFASETLSQSRAEIPEFRYLIRLLFEMTMRANHKYLQVGRSAAVYERLAPAVCSDELYIMSPLTIKRYFDDVSNCRENQNTDFLISGRIIGHSVQ